MTTLKIKNDSYKIGVDEIEGLQAAMLAVTLPILESVKENVYWHDDLCFEATEYRARDGFMPYSSNCGGVELSLIIPKCESYEFDWLDFGECDECYKDTKNGELLQCGYQGQECGADNEGHLDARIRVWLKFEGLENGVMSFYLVLNGGNGDAPYFRDKCSETYFESEFEAKTLSEFKRIAKQHVAKLLKVME